MYRDDILPYRRVADNKVRKKISIDLFSFRHLLLLLSALLVSRVVMLKALMPFGVAFLVAAYSILNRFETFLVSIFVALGYVLSFQNYLSYSHVVTVLALMIFIPFLSENKKIYKFAILAFIINILVNIAFRFYVNLDILPYDIIVSIFESFIMVSSAYIFSYGIPLYFNKQSRKLFSKEEIICFILALSLVVSGLWDINIYGFSLKNVISMLVVICFGYSEGASMGAAVGVTMGVVSGISDPSMAVNLGIFGFSGLIAGVFKDYNKFIVAVSFVIATAMLSFYSLGSITLNNVFLEAMIASSIFMIMPTKKFKKLTSSLDGDKKIIELQKSYIEKVKGLMEIRLSSMSSTLYDISSILQENIENELSKKQEINSLVEKIADRVCANCDCKSICWGKELYYTYDSIVEMLRLIEKKGMLSVMEMPESMRRKCIRPTEIMKQSIHLLEIMRLNNRWRKKLINSRMILSEQIKGISSIIESMVKETSNSIVFRNDVEEEIAVELDKAGLEFDNIVALKNGREKYEITFYRKPCRGKNLCVKEFERAVSRALGMKMVVDGSGCRIDENKTMCQFRLIEAESFSLVTAVAKASKEKVSGDTYYFGNIGEGRYMIALSDGMGSGRAANMESNTTIALLEKLMEAGFERNTAIKAINSVLVLRSCDESFATVDMGLIDLYSGIGEFIKIGAAPTFIKSGREVEVIKSSALPVGILDDIDIESHIVEFRSGDMIVMVSDGVVDCNDELKEKWIIKALKEFDSGNPKDVADYLLNKAKEFYGNNIKDDMTVIVSKIWKIS
ncbi:stage II sporulation protein E [Caloramator proteoclasticus]|uniref:Stage II sporulation protein E n=1 Tax=Caloramator proteoclasticus DSM 10124 TaxID=1121262 RepID=A0A1M4YMT9_9CLOT|nr:stage II sporulation protein E [Caloramator proteoclasticus]SHF07124.1 stage II sporulation protein E [Caloramator proteoclasticus DSM 10124]